MLLAEGLKHADRGRFSYSYGYFLPWKNAMVESLLQQGVSVQCFDVQHGALMLLSVRRVVRQIKNKRVDLIHAHLPLAGVVARIAGRLTGVPVIYTEHNVQERYQILTRVFNSMTWPLQSRAIAVSADVEQSIRRHMHTRVPVRTIRNGVDVQRFSRTDDVKRRAAELRHSLRIAMHAPVVGTIAVFRLQKQLNHWLAVARKVQESVPAVRFLLVGDGPERASLEAQARGLRLQVHFAGLQVDTEACLAAMDVFLMTSKFEGLPLALLEAMAMSVAPVATSVGGIPEVVAAPVNGCLRSHADIDGLAADVMSLLNDSARCSAIGAAARATIVDHFSTARMQREIEQLYVEVLRTNKVGAAE